jgi:hypothetical protein
MRWIRTRTSGWGRCCRGTWGRSSPWMTRTRRPSPSPLLRLQYFPAQPPQPACALPHFPQVAVVRQLFASPPHNIQPPAQCRWYPHLHPCASDDPLPQTCKRAQSIAGPSLPAHPPSLSPLSTSRQAPLQVRSAEGVVWWYARGAIARHPSSESVRCWGVGVGAARAWWLAAGAEGGPAGLFVERMHRQCAAG